MLMEIWIKSLKSRKKWGAWQRSKGWSIFFCLLSSPHQTVVLLHGKKQKFWTLLPNTSIFNFYIRIYWYLANAWVQGTGILPHRMSKARKKRGKKAWIWAATKNPFFLFAPFFGAPNMADDICSFAKVSSCSGFCFLLCFYIFVGKCCSVLQIPYMGVGRGKITFFFTPPSMQCSITFSLLRWVAE